MDENNERFHKRKLFEKQTKNNERFHELIGKRVCGEVGKRITQKKIHYFRNI